MDNTSSFERKTLLTRRVAIMWIRMAPSNGYCSPTRLNEYVSLIVFIFIFFFFRGPSTIVLRCSVVITVVGELFVVDDRFPVVLGFHAFSRLVYRAPRRFSGFGRREQHRIRCHVVLFAVMDPVQEINQEP